jgi:disulfide bond formation protein DsbB
VNKVLYTFLAASIIAIAGALTMQYGFDKPPCHLCIMQRIPYIAMIAVSSIGLLLTKYKKFFVVICAVLLLTEIGLAIFHSGVEEKLWKGPSTCSGKDFSTTAIEDIKTAIFKAPLVKCDEKAYLYKAISIAEANVLFAILTLAFAVRFYRAPLTTN